MRRFRVDDTDYDFDPESLYDLTIGEARAIKAQTGLTVTDWRLGLVTSYRQDPDVLAGIVWVVRRRAGETVDWADIDRISTTELLESVIDLDEPAEEPAETVSEPAPETDAKRNGRKRTNPTPAEPAAVPADAS